MALRKSRLSRLRGINGRKGVALIIVLGVVALLMILVMAFAFDAQTTSQSAAMMNDASSARLMARGGLERATSLIAGELGSGNDAYKLNPAVYFYEPGIGTPTVDDWKGRAYLPSASTGSYAHDTDIIPSLQVSFATTGSDTVAFTSATSTLVTGVSFDTITVTKDMSGVSKNPATSGNFSSNVSTLIGRVAYIIIDCTGFVDPANVVNSTVDEMHSAGTGPLADRTGADMDELQMADLLGDSLDNGYLRSFQPKDNNGELSLTNPFWMSYAHMVRSTQPTQAEFDSTVTSLYPLSRLEPEQYYVETSAGTDSDAADLNELRDRLALDRLGIDVDTEDVYDQLIGYHASINTSRDSVAQYSPWLASTGVGASTDSARTYAARLALYMADRVDANRNVSYAIIDGTDGSITIGNSIPTPTVLRAAVNAGDRVVYGMEEGPYLSELEVELEVIWTPATVNGLSVTPKFRAEWFDPWQTAGVTAVQATVNYDIDISETGTCSVVQANETVVISASANSAAAGLGGSTGNNPNGQLYTRTVAQNGNFLGSLGITGLIGGGWTLNKFKINSVVVSYTTASGTFVTRNFPAHTEGPEDYWCQWVDGLTVYPASGSLFAHVAAKDPLFCEADGRTADFTKFWTERTGSVENAMTTSNASAGQIGVTTGFLGYANVAYGDIESPQLGAFTRIGQLGDLHSPYRLSESIRLWDAASDGSDARILDMFYIDGDRTKQRGRINLNTGSWAVIYSLFKGIKNSIDGLDISKPMAGELASELRDLNGTGSTQVPLTYRGDLAPLFGNLAVDLGVTSVDDNYMEDYVERMIELTSTRYNHYLVVVDAQSLKDLGVIPDAQATAIGAIQWKNGGSANTHSWFSTLAEQKLLAYIERDAYTNSLRILRVEAIE